VRPTSTDGWNSVAHEFRTACKEWNQRQDSPYSRHLITCGALTCVGHQLSTKWNTLAKEKKPTGCSLESERTSQVQALQREIEEDIQAGNIGVKLRMSTSPQAADVASSADAQSLSLIERDAGQSDDLDTSGKELIAEAGKYASKLKKSQAGQLTALIEALEKRKRDHDTELDRLNRKFQRKRDHEFRKLQMSMVSMLCSALGKVDADDATDSED